MDVSRDRAVASVLGLAIGDALGAPFEFCRSADVPDPLPAFTRPWMGMPPGTWTDDTAMARNLWLSLIAHRGELDTDDVLARHVAWLRTGPPDVGSLTRHVLSRAAAGAADAAREYVERRGPEVSAGNGSVMYCAPLGVVHAATPERLDELAPALSALTHWDARCRTACLAVTRTAAGLVRGEDPQTAVLDAVTTVADREGGEELEYLVERGRPRPAGRRPRHGLQPVHRRARAPGGGRRPRLRGRAALHRELGRRHGHERGGGGCVAGCRPRHRRLATDVARTSGGQG